MSNIESVLSTSIISLFFASIITTASMFFETFPVILVDSAGTLRADIAFRRASSSNSIEQRYPTLILSWFGGIYDGL